MGSEKLTPEEINKGKDFNKLYKNYTAMKTQWFRSPKKLGGIASTVLVTVVIVVTVIKFKRTTSTRPAQTKQVTAAQTHRPAAAGATHSVSRPFINPPIKKADIAYKSYTVNSAKGGILKYGEKTKITIPKNCFVDKNGKTVSGDVVIKYREFHTPLDFFLSGIPMTYDSAGKQYTFQSAGMLDIKGFKDGEPVNIREGKNIDVQMASSGKGTTYNTYILDTVKRKWVYIERSKIKLSQASTNKTNGGTQDSASTINPGANALKNKLAATKKEETRLENTLPLKPQKHDPSRYSFDINADAKDFPELAVYKNMTFDVDANDKTFDPKYMKETWTGASLKRQSGSTYTFSVKRGPESHTFIVHPVFNSKDYDAAIKEYDKKYAEYQQALAAKKAEEQKEREEYAAMLKKQEEQAKEQAAEQQKLLKVEEATASTSSAIIDYCEIRNFGIYNCDFPGVYPKGAELMARYVNQKRDSINTYTIYLAEEGRNAIFSYYPGGVFKFDPDKKNVAWCVTADNKIAVFTKDDFDKIQQRSGDYTFVMQVVNKDIKSEDDVKDIFKSLL